jgi:hypothetical protein
MRRNIRILRIAAWSAVFLWESTSPNQVLSARFVSPGGQQWVERFYKMRNHPLVDEFYQLDCVGSSKEGDNIHERNNRWAPYSALTRGIEKVRLVAVWDGKCETQVD